MKTKHVLSITLTLSLLLLGSFSFAAPVTFSENGEILAAP